MIESNAKPIGTRTSKWGEGPVWWDNRLMYVDIGGRAIVTLDPVTCEETVRDLDQPVGFVAPCASGRWIWGGEHGLYLLDPETGASNHLCDPESDKPANRFNDAGVSPDGRLFAGTIVTNKVEGAANLYRMDENLRCAIAYSRVTNSNGIAWSPDGDACYYIDTPTRKVLRFSYCDQSGCLDDPQPLIDTDPVIDASPDGMCVDAEGNLWIAFCHGGCVIRFDSGTGRELHRIEVPCRETTSCCFGGVDLGDLYITTGLSSQNDEEHAGKVFVVRNAGVKGLPQVAFKDG